MTAWARSKPDKEQGMKDELETLREGKASNSEGVPSGDWTRHLMF